MFFYNADTRVAASGKLDAAGDYIHLKSFPANQFGAWTRIVSLRDSMILFSNAETGQAAVGKLNSTGDYTHLKDLPLFGKGHIIVPVDDSRLFTYYPATGAAKTGKIDAAGNYTNLKELPAGQFGPWQDIVSLDGGMLFFYHADWDDALGGTKAASGMIDTFGNYTHLQTFPTGQFGKWSQVLALAGRWLYFHLAQDSLNAPAATGKVSPDGKYSHVKSISTNPGYWNVVPVEGYQLFHYRSGTTTRAASGRIDSTGDVKQRDFGNAFGLWSLIAG
jgi:hypothetical protein